MKLACLFWCYKEPALCRDRLELLRRHNPTTPIYVLFGGAPDQADRVRAAFGELVDDFYTFTDPPPAGLEPEGEGGFRAGTFWKYTHGDLLIAAWHRDRGRELAFDTLVVVQWDMLVFGPLEQVFECLGPGEALFSGLRPVSEVQHRWIWATPSRPDSWKEYQAFRAHVRDVTGYQGEPLCCLTIVMALPRTFLDRYVELERPELGFIEYRLPTWAAAWGVPLCREHPFRPWWGTTERYRLFSPLRALPREIWAPTLALNLLRPGGARVFHPWWRETPRGLWGWTWVLLDSVPRILRAAWRSAAKRSRHARQSRRGVEAPLE